MKKMATNPSYPSLASANRTSASGRVKLDELAAHLGLSKSTVSRALNGYPDISDSDPELRVEVAWPQTMGHRPLSHAQAIRTGRVRSHGAGL